MNGLNKPYQSGFSLLEVLIALVIAAITCGLAFSIIGNNSRTAAINQDYQTALLLAQTRMTEISIDPLLWLGEHQGTFDDHFHWQLSVAPYQLSTVSPVENPYQLYRIDLRVGWQGKSQAPIRLSTLKLWSEQ